MLNPKDVGMKDLQGKVKEVNDLDLLVDDDGNKIKIKFVGVKKQTLMDDFVAAIEWLDDNDHEIPVELVDFYNLLQDDADAPEESDVPEEEEAPEEDDVPEEKEAPEESDVPEEKEAPEESDAPEEEEAPEEDDVPEEKEAPVKVDKKAEKAKAKAEAKVKAKADKEAAKAKKKADKAGTKKEGSSIHNGEVEEIAGKIADLLKAGGGTAKENITKIIVSYPNKSEGYMKSLYNKINGTYTGITGKKDNAYGKAFRALQEDKKPSGVCTAIISTVKRFQHLFVE